jgi:hypothetical protein
MLLDNKLLWIVAGIVLLFVFALMTNQTKEEMADVTQDVKDAISKVYAADVAAIRNLSDVATKLQAGGLTIPGTLGVRNDLNVGGNLILDNNNKWILHTPDDGRKTLYIAPATDDLKAWKWNQGIMLTTNGILKVNRPENEGWPQGWGGGVHTWDFKSDGTANLNFCNVAGQLTVSGRNILAELNALRADVNALRNEVNTLNAAAPGLRRDLDDIRDNAIRKDKRYFIQSGRGGFLPDAGGWWDNNNDAGVHDWRSMFFRERK